MSLYRQHPPHRPSLWQQLGRLACFLLLLGGIASAIFLLFFRGYVISTPEGPRLQLPMGVTQDPPAQSVFSKEDAIVVTNAPDPLQSLHLPQRFFWGEDVGKALREAGANAAMFDLRDADGRLHYVSALPQAIACGASEATPGLNEAIRAMNRQEGLYTIARVSCFSDERLAAWQPSLALQREGGVPWRDTQNRRWLSPGQDEVQAYLLGICRELEALGFDEVLLVDCAYPQAGALSQVFQGSESPERLSLTLTGFYQELRRQLPGEALRLSLLWESSQSTEEGLSVNGQDLAVMLPLADRIFYHAEEEDAVSVFLPQGHTSALLAPVPISSQKGGKNDPWAILP